MGSSIGGTAGLDTAGIFEPPGGDDQESGFAFLSSLLKGTEVSPSVGCCSRECQFVSAKVARRKDRKDSAISDLVFSMEMGGPGDLVSLPVCFQSRFSTKGRGERLVAFVVVVIIINIITTYLVTQIGFFPSWVAENWYPSWGPRHEAPSR